MTSNDIVNIRPAGSREWIGQFTAEELSNDRYHEEAPGISKSHLDVINDGSPRHYWQCYLNPDRPAHRKTPALVLGDAIHVAMLQPNLFEHRYAVKPDVDGRTRDGKSILAQFRRENSNKIEISQGEFDCCVGIRDSVYSHPVARGLFTGGVAEHSFFAIDPETGALIKCRPDYLADEYVIDIKSTLDAGPHAFGKDATNYRYDVAVPWYLDIIGHVTGRGRARKWLWVAVEKQPPYAIGIYMAQKHDITRARDTARRNLLTILKYRKLNSYPDYGETIQPLMLKSWAVR